MSNKKYACHSGYVVSKTDGQRHFISGYELMRLYDVNPTDCVVCSGKHSTIGMNDDDYIHLYPRYDGNYKTPTER